MARNDALEGQKRYLSDRQEAYKILLGPDAAEAARATALEIFFADMEFYSYRNQGIPISKGEAGLDRVEGRREMVMRIEDHLTMDFETLWRVYGEGMSREAAWQTRRQERLNKR